MSQPLISLDHVSFAYGDAPALLQDVSLDIRSGWFVHIRGASGSGKSTFLRLLCRLEEPATGIILYQGTDISEVNPPALRREISYLQQVPALLPGTIRENLLLPFRFRENRHRSRPDKGRIQEFLDRFLLQQISPDSPASALSVGQKQRLCLIRSLLLEPRVLLLDEPTSALDPQSAKIVLDAAKTLNREHGVTILLVTHSGEVLDPDVRTLSVSRGKAVFT